jgi:acetolactate synthase I/II/III large subunit
MAALDAAMGKAKSGAAADARRARVAEAQEKAIAGRKAAVEKSRTGGPMELAWLGHCLGEVRGSNDIVVSESQIPLPYLNCTAPGSFFGNSPAAGLGWGNGCALGAKLAARDKRVFSLVGDGSYMFGNPTPTHFVGQSMDLPVLTVVVNNRMWGAVRKATLGLHPEGAASRMNTSPLTMIEPSPEYEKIVEANGGYGECVKNAEDLPAAIERALKAVEVDKRQALLNVMTSYDDAQALADARR